MMGLALLQLYAPGTTEPALKLKPVPKVSVKVETVVVAALVTVLVRV
jgi:hypothetical protein